MRSDKLQQKREPVRAIFQSSKIGRIMETVIINFNLNGGTGAEHEKSVIKGAPVFAAVTGLACNAYLAHRTSGVFGGVYAFKDGASVDAFMRSELFASLGKLSISEVSARRFGVLLAPSAVARGLVAYVASMHHPNQQAFLLNKKSTAALPRLISFFFFCVYSFCFVMFIAFSGCQSSFLSVLAIL